MVDEAPSRGRELLGARIVTLASTLPGRRSYGGVAASGLVMAGVIGLAQSLDLQGLGKAENPYPQECVDRRHHGHPFGDMVDTLGSREGMSRCRSRIDR